jgi:hypothetical protein
MRHLRWGLWFVATVGPALAGVLPRVADEWPPSGAAIDQPPPPGATAAIKTPALTDARGDALPPGARLRLGTLRFRCLADVHAIAVSPNGQWLAVGALHGHDAVLFAGLGRLRERHPFD